MTDLQARLQAAIGDRYDVVRQIGRGGMATVYLAHDLRHERDVAVKVLRPELAATVGVERFLREIKLAARLSHPHILPLFDSDEAEGLLLYVMPYVEGESLRARIGREKQLSQEDAIDIGVAVAMALDYAHRHDVVHRDIKPENIMMHDGVAVVADFGIGKAMSTVNIEDITGTGVAIGTPAYMSPEQASGDARVEGRSDIFSLGCVLYEMLVGEPPFSGPTAQAVISKRFTGVIPRVSTVRTTVSSELDEIVRRALARVPADRFARASHLAHALASNRTPTWSTTTGKATRGDRSIAVLPLANVGNNPDNEYLSDGISEELIHALGKVEGLRVVGRTSAFAFKGKNEDIRTIGERLNASAVLEGSVRAVGNRMRITAQLISADTGYELFSESYDRELDDVLGVQVEIAKSIVKSLTVTLLVDDGPMFESATDNFEAYELYLRGRFQWNKRTEDGLRQSVDYLTQSVAADPNFAVAFAGLADSYATLGIYGGQPTGEVMPLAREAANRALALDSTLSEALTSLGCVASVYDWDWEAAENYFGQAIEENPKYPVAHQWYAVNCLAPLGRFREARAQLSRARTLDPLSLVVNLSHGLSRYLERNYDGAVEEYQKVLEIDPRFGMAHYFLGQVHERRGEHDEALTRFDRAIELTGGSPEITAAVGHAYATAGRVDEAREVISQLQEPSEARYVSPALIGQVYVGLGEHDAALEWLDRGKADRSAEMIWLSVRPLFDSLRADKRFIDLLRDIGFAEQTIHDTSPEARSGG